MMDPENRITGSGLYVPHVAAELTVNGAVRIPIHHPFKIVFVGKEDCVGPEKAGIESTDDVPHARMIEWVGNVFRQSCSVYGLSENIRNVRILIVIPIWQGEVGVL